MLFEASNDNGVRGSFIHERHLIYQLFTLQHEDHRINQEDNIRYKIKQLPLEVQQAIKAQSSRPHKYGAKKTVCLHGHTHDSQKEATWCVKLHQEQREGKIRNLLLQVPYDLRVNGVIVCKHILDFDYERIKVVQMPQEGHQFPMWCPEVVDVKGMRLPVWSLKHKLFKSIYTGINYVIV